MQLNIYLNPASIICGLAVIVIVLLIRSYDPKLVDRVSLRLTVVISAVSTKADHVFAFESYAII